MPDLTDNGPIYLGTSFATRQWENGYYDASIGELPQETCGDYLAGYREFITLNGRITQ